MQSKNNKLARFSAFRKWTTVAFLLITLAACGGGGGGISRDSTQPPDTGDTNNTLNISLSITNAITGGTSNQLSDESPLIVTATVTDVNGDPVSDQLVTYNFNIPDLAFFDPASGTALSNTQGISTIGLTVGTIEGDGLITAQLQTGESAQIGFSSAGDLNDGIKTIALTITSKNTGAPDNNLTLDNPLIVSAVVLGSDETPVNDELITFTFSELGLALFVPDAGTALTGTDGSASIELVAGSNAGAGLVTATLSSGETAEIGFNSSGGSVVVTPPNFTLDLSVADLDSGETQNELSRESPLRITTVLVDINGDPVVDQLVTYSLSNPDLAVFEPENGETLTDENGVSTIILGVGTLAGDGLVIASIPTGEVGQIGFSSAGDANLGVKTITLSIVNSETGEPDNALSIDNPLTVRANVVNGSGVPLTDELIEFTLTDTNLAFFEPASGTALTSSDGNANIGLRAGQNAGAGKVVATLGSGEIAEIGFNSTGGAVVVIPPDFTIEMTISELVSGEPGNQLNATNPLLVTSTITDINGDPVVDQLVTYSLSNPELAVFQPENGETLTNANGVSTMILGVGAIAGDGLVVATIPTGESGQIGFSSAGDANPGSKTVALSIVNAETGETDNTLSLNNSLRVNASVLDGSGVPINDELIQFTLTDDTLAFFEPASGTALTNTNGAASIGLQVGANAGAGKVLATLGSGETAEIGFNSTGGAVVVTPPDFTIEMTISELVSGEQNNQLSSDTPLVITSTVMDINGDPVVDQLVTYTFSNDTLATFDPINGETLTNTSGVSRVTLRVGAIAGDGLVFATLPTGEQAQIGFSSAGDLGSQGKALELSIVNAGTGEADNNLSSANPLVVEARVVTNAGLPVADELLTFTLSDDNLAFFNPASGTALTDANGLARIQLLVGLQAGAGKVFVALESGETDEIGFNSAGDGQVITEQPATLDFFASSLILASSGSDQVELIALVKNEDNILMEGVAVSFSSDSGELSIAQGTTQADGTARAFLTSQNNPENRTITVRAEAGSLSESLTIDVTGTVININAPNSVILNDTGDVSIVVANSDGIGIANQTVTLSSLVDGAIVTQTPVTDQTGQLTVTYNAVQSGVDVITATALNATSTQEIVVQEDQFSFSRASENEVNLNTDEAITITWLKDNVPFEGGNVVFTTTRGTLSSTSGTTDANGQITVNANSATAGNVIIGARGTDNDNNEVSARLEYEYVATQVDSIIVSASPNSIGPGGQKSTVTAVLRDPIGNLVKGKTIVFTANDVSGGEIFPPTAVTDSNGIASTVFTSNTVTSENAVVITATEEESGVAGDASITVADRALFISIGTGNSIESPTTDSYLKRFALFVTDANSNPVSNVDLTVSGTPVKFGDSRAAYFKGVWVEQPSADAFEFWAAVRTASCANEDQDDDAILDVGEDLNGDGELTPGNIIAIDGNVTTDENGQAEIVLRYPKTFGAWVTVNIVASTPVAGSENRTSQYYTLGVSAEDAALESSPPNVNPFGQGASCLNTD